MNDTNDELVDLLTPRQMTVLGMLAEGMSKPEIAEQLGITENTVRSHTKRIYKAIGASSLVDAILIYLGHRDPRPPEDEYGRL